MNVSDEAKQALRTALAESICTSQASHTPRSRVEQMRYSLLCHALLALDPGSGVDDAIAVRIAVHALIEWRGSLPGVSRYPMP